MGGYGRAVKEIDWDAVAEAEIAMTQITKAKSKKGSAVDAALRLTKDTEEE
jgi:hypothetical protein